MKKHSKLDSKYWHHYISINDPKEIESLVKEVFFNYDDKEIHLDILDNEKSKGNIIFLPGTAIYSRFYIDFCYLLWKNRFRVFMPDMVGHGLSEGRRGHFTMNKFTETVSSLINYIQENYTGKICVMGSSLGGVSSLYSVAADSRIDIAICHNAAIFNEKAYKYTVKVKGISRLLQPVLPYIAKIFPRIKISVFRYLQKEDLADSSKGFKLFDLFLKDPLLQGKYTFKSLRSQMRDALYKPIEEIINPIMFINGENDGIFPLNYLKSIFNRLPNEKNEFVVIKDATHLLFQENTLECLDIVLPFLDKHLG